MLMPSQGVRILVATRPADFRKGHDGLAALVQSVLQEDPKAWRLFVERYSRLFFGVIWRFASGNVDLCADLFLYAIEGLHKTSRAGEPFFRLKRYMQSLERYGEKGKFSTQGSGSKNSQGNRRFYFLDRKRGNP